MTKGILGIVACPMLENELIYSLKADEGVDNIYVVDTEHCGSLRKKLDFNGLAYRMVGFDDFLSDNLVIDRLKFSIVIYMNDLGLHAEPKDLKAFVEEEIESIQSHVDVLGIYYGLCGNYGWDLTSWCKEKGFCPTEVFRDDQGHVCDDCVGVCVGGGPRYFELEKTYTGMLYVTPTIASNWRDFLSASDIMKGIDSMNRIESLREFNIKTPDDYMRWMFKMCGYQNILQIDNGLEDRSVFDRYTDEMSTNLDLEVLQAESGWATIQPAEDLYAACKRDLDGL